MKTETTSDARNRDRRFRYANDPDYRSQVVQATRARYREKRGLKKRRSAHAFDLRRVGKYCERHDVWWGVRVLHNRQVMSIRNLALIIGRKPDVVKRWINEDMLSAPEIEVLATGDKVYLLEEVREIVHVMRDHQDETPYFRQDHNDTIDLLRSVLVGIRESL